MLAGSNTEQQQLIKALYGRKLKEAAKDPKLKIEVIALITTWRAYLGATKVDEHGNMLDMEAKYLIEKHGELTIDELRFCIDLHSTNQLDVQYREFVQFSGFHPHFMSQVLNKYIQFKNQNISELREKLEREPPEAPPPPTAAEKMNSMKEMITGVKQQIDAGSEFIFMLNDVFSFLRRTQRLVLNDNIIEEAKKYAAKKLREQKPDSDIPTLQRTMNSSFSKEQKDNKHRIFATEYCIKSFFEMHDLADVLSGITESEFQ